jgi:uncharacterized protein YvpB
MVKKAQQNQAAANGATKAAVAEATKKRDAAKKTNDDAAAIDTKQAEALKARQGEEAITIKAFNKATGDNKAAIAAMKRSRAAAIKAHEGFVGHATSTRASGNF